jgi:AcrR family transcriptional regulator
MEGFMNTLRRFSLLLLLIFIASAAMAQEESGLSPQVQAFVDSFERVDDVGKLEVVQSTLDVPVADLESFYEQVIKYVVDNSDQVLTNTQIREMALITLPRVREGVFTGMNDWVWALFTDVQETFWRIEVLETLGAVGAGDAQLAVDMTAWLDGQNISKQAGSRPDNQVILAMVQALVQIADPISYPVLVESVLVQYSGQISAAAISGIIQYEDRAQMLADLVLDSQPAEKRELYTLYLNRDEFDDVILEVSFDVLNDVLSIRPNNVEDRIVLDSIRMDAVRILSANPQEAYAPALIRHFNAAIQSYDRGTADKGLVLEAIGALGQTDSVDAAIRLAEFLDLINTYTELDRPYDRQITLAVINNLKTLGKVEAYQPLYMVTILNYSSGVQEAAQEALEVVSQ